MKLSDDDGTLAVDTDTDSREYFSRHRVALLLAAIDSGHGDAIRHYAEHGRLPPADPVWPGWEVTRETRPALAWACRRKSVPGVARVTTDHTGRWYAYIPGFALRFTTPNAHETPQAAVDALRAELRAMAGGGA